MGVTSYTKTAKVACSHCAELRFTSTIERHEAACGKNPANLDSCPVCSGPKLKSKLTCSHSCRNKLLFSGENHPNWKEIKSDYRSICFAHHKKECVVCGEDKIVEVHHLDHKRSNNDPSNLIPLCPTHHKYWHSRHKHVIKAQVNKYIETWKQDRV